MRSEDKRFKKLEYAIRIRLNELRDRCWIDGKLDEQRITIFAKAIRAYSHEYHTAVYDAVVANYYKRLGRGEER